MPAVSIATVKTVVITTCSKWSDHDVPRLGAALAYYTLLSLAPLAVFLVSLCGLVLTKTSAEQQLFGQARELFGTAGAKTLQALVDNSQQSHGGILASVIAVVALLFGASGVFAELRDSMNTIWDAPPPSSSGVGNFVWRKVVTFLMVLALGFLLLASLLVSAALGIAEKYFAGVVSLSGAWMGEVANVLVSLVAISVLFALIFRFVPDVSIDWEDVGIGAVVTAVLFTIGRGLLAFYMSTAAVGSTYGAAGSLVAMVVWVYYSAQIFFFGAVFTRIYSDCCGSRFRSRARHAERSRAKAG